MNREGDLPKFEKTGDSSVTRFSPELVPTPAFDLLSTFRIIGLVWVIRKPLGMGHDISSDGGLLPYRELDHALGLTELGGEVLSETRRGKNTRHLLVVACPHFMYQFLC